jgi:MFS family permease
LLGALVAALVTANFTPAGLLETGWRLPFILGGLFGMVSVWLRSWLHETPVFRDMQARREISQELPLKTVLRAHLPAVVLTMLLTWLLSAAVVTMILMTPTLLQTLHAIDAHIALTANIVATMALTAGCIIFGALAGRIGAGWMLLIGSVGLGITSVLFYRIMFISAEHIFLLYGLCGFFVGVIGVIPAVCVMAFPPSIRFTGLSFSYNVSYAVFGGLTPVFVSLLLPVVPMAPAYYVAALCLLGMVIAMRLIRSAAQPSARAS